jgi:membrane dipeptidase
MVKNKNYSGYKAFDYLKPGIDYKEFKLRKAIIEKWEHKVPLSKTEEDRFEELLEKNIVIDLHEHPCHYPDPIKYSPDLTLEGRQFFAYHALSKSGIDCIFDNLMDGRATINTKHGWDWLSSIHDLGTRLCDISQQNFVIQCKRVEDIKYAHKNGSARARIR